MKNGLMPKFLTYTNFSLIYYLEIQIYGSLYICILSFRSDFLWTCHFEYDWMTLCNYYTLCPSYQKDVNLGYEHASRNASLPSYQNTVEALPIMVEHLVMCDSLSKMFVYTNTSTSYWFTSHKIHFTRQFAGFTCLCFIENVWRTHLCHGCRPQCVLVSTPLYAQIILCALWTASWHTTMQSLHSRRLSTLNTEDEYTRDFTYPHKQNSSGFGHSSVETTPSVHLYLPNTRSQCNTLSVEAWYVLRVLDYLCLYIINSIM